MNGMNPNWTTLVDVVRHRAQQMPDQRAFVYLDNGRDESVSLTYGDLDRAARRVAARLQCLGAKRERVLLLYPHGLDFIAALFGCMYAGAVAVPALPASRPGHSLDRLASIVADASPHVTMVSAALADALTQSAILDTASTILEVTENLCAGNGDATLTDGAGSVLDPDATCLLQYTSGSTGAPKGVMISHRNILRNEEMILDRFEHTRESVVVSWLPVYHDMGLIGMIFQPLFVGNPCILMSPVSFLQRPIRWLQAITHYRATTSGGPNFAYDMCVDRIREKDCEGLDLSSLEIAYSGAEPIREATLNRFTERFAPYGFRREAFYPCYGLAESTLMVTAGKKLSPLRIREVDAGVLETDHRAEAATRGAPTRSLVGCGTSPAGQRVRIIDPAARIALADGLVGEIWVSGPCLAAGYRNQESLNQEIFQAQLADDEASRYLRTGDLGFMDDGELYVTGRIKELLIIRGKNHYPQDIEATAEKSHSALRPAASAAFLLEDDSPQQLVLVHEIERKHMTDPDVEGIATSIREAVTREHGLRVSTVVLLRPGMLPKTSSGKIRRGECKKRLISGVLPVIGKG
jgi:acyl-CoA synthetase (AMP-forming)/AMP-acid ligase II